MPPPPTHTHTTHSFYAQWKQHYYHRLIISTITAWCVCGYILQFNYNAMRFLLNMNMCPDLFFLLRDCLQLLHEGWKFKAATRCLSCHFIVSCRGRSDIQPHTFFNRGVCIRCRPSPVDLSPEHWPKPMFFVRTVDRALQAFVSFSCLG
jgi:hypothetical protein